MINDSCCDGAFLSPDRTPSVISIRIRPSSGILTASNRVDTLVWINLHKLPDIVTAQSHNSISWPLAISQPFAVRDTKPSLIGVVT